MFDTGINSSIRFLPRDGAIVFFWVRRMQRYFKRYRMEIDLGRLIPRALPVPGYEFWAWQSDLLEYHAEVKFGSFVGEIDAQVFPCLGELHGCTQLMHEISTRDNFLPEATWLAVVGSPLPFEPPVPCGTIQGLCGMGGMGSIQNIGTLPEHRGQGLATSLILRALRGFQEGGLRKATLEVTANNQRAVRLYQSLGFRLARTVYKSVDVAYS